MGADDEENAGDDKPLVSAGHKSGSTRTGGGAGLFCGFCRQFAPPDDLTAIDFPRHRRELAEHEAAVVLLLDTVDTESRSPLPIADQLLGGLELRHFSLPN